MENYFVKVNRVNDMYLANLQPIRGYGYYIGVFDCNNKLLGVLSTAGKRTAFKVCYQSKPFTYQQISYYGRKPNIKVDVIPKIKSEYYAAYADDIY